MTIRHLRDGNLIWVIRESDESDQSHVQDATAYPLEEFESLCGRVLNEATPHPEFTS